MKFFKAMLFTVVASASLIVAGQQHCGQKGSDMGMHNREGKGCYMHIPNITPEQSEKIYQIYTATQKSMIELQAKVQILKLEIAELVNNQVDKAKINSKVDECAKVCSQTTKIRIDTHQKIVQLLTEEQKKVFKFRQNCACESNFTGCEQGKGFGKKHGCGMDDADDSDKED